MLMKLPSLAVALPLGLAVLFAQLACSVHAGTWVWLDDAGRRVYSDVPPPSHLPDKRILQQPGKPKLSTSTTAQEVASPVQPPAPGVPKTPQAQSGSSAPANPAALRKQQEAQKTADAERTAQEEKRALVRTENCRRAQSALATLESGVRLMATNEQGQQVVYDDAMRAQERGRLQATIQDNCN